jgi:hypothetical protein
MTTRTETNSAFLFPNERILFQIKEGMCSRRCVYCYEKGKASKEMPFEVLEHGFKMLKSLNIKEAELIGSEPTEYSKWDLLIQLAKENELGLTVYTSGLHLERLDNDQVKGLIMHVMFEPDKAFMEGVMKLLDRGQFIYLRVNFDSEALEEKNIIHSFLNQLPARYHAQVSLKYSFTAKTEDPALKFTDIAAFKRIKPEFLMFCKETHSLFPDVSMYSERPIFKCCFTPEEREDYAYAGLDSRCNMEYTVYKDSLIGLCPPVERLIPKRKIETDSQMIRSISELRREMQKLAKKPSFEECKSCEFSQDASCQGGCFSYKL